MRRNTPKIEGVSINDLAVSYAGAIVRCRYTHSDGYVEYQCELKVRSLKKTKKSGEHIVHGEVRTDINRPGEDASAELIWQSIHFRFNEIEKTGKAYYPRLPTAWRPHPANA